VEGLQKLVGGEAGSYAGFARPDDSEAARLWAVSAVVQAVAERRQSL
jgi:hypothetical protein